MVSVSTDSSPPSDQPEGSEDKHDLSPGRPNASDPPMFRRAEAAAEAGGRELLMRALLRKAGAGLTTGICVEIGKVVAEHVLSR